VAVGLLAAGCPAKKPKYPSCDGDKDCSAGEKCVNKKCVKCTADKDCGPGKMCKDGACEPIVGWCSADGDCPAGQVCKDHKCSACAADAECGEGGRCKEGKCLRKGQCSVDEDCAEDEDCIKGVCVKGGAAGGDGAVPSCALEQVLFDFDSPGVREDAKRILQKDAECLSQTTRGVTLIAHTDPRGTDEYNIALSDQRGRAVADYLARLGVDPGRMRVVPKGEAEATGTDDASWARDRRVELTWE